MLMVLFCLRGELEILFVHAFNTLFFNNFCLKPFQSSLIRLLYPSLTFLFGFQVLFVLLNSCLAHKSALQGGGGGGGFGM